MNDMTDDEQLVIRKAIQCAHDNGLRIGRESAAEGVRLGIETATKAFAPVLDTIVKTFEKITDSNADTVRKAMSAFVDGSGGELVRPAGCIPKRRSKKRKKVMKGSFDMAPYGYCPECFSVGCFPQQDGAILCFQGHRFDKDDAEYASTQIDLTGGIRERLAEFSAQIADGDLIEDGRETDFHITAKFGLHYSDATMVSAIVADFGPVHYYVSDFAAFQNDEYDVLYARVESDDLYRLNAKLSELCCTTTHPTYTPHATVAYLNPGLADKYIRRFGGISLRGTADTLTFSSPSREETKIPLGGTPLGSVAKGMKDDSGHEHGGDGKFTGSGSSGGDTQSSSEPAKEKPKHQPVELAVHSHATKLVRDAGRHKTPERVQELVDSTREKVKTAYAREWKHIQDSVRAKYGDDVADDPAMEEVKGILKDGLRSANASIDEMENGLMNGAKRGSLMPGSMFLDGASEEADAIQKHQTETMDRAFNRLALVISKHKGVVKKSVHLREDLLGEDESDPDPMDALTQAVVEEVYAAREQGDDDAVRAIIERYREMIDDPALLEEYAGGVVKKGWSESDHPRSKTGQFIAKDDLKEAQTNPEKAKELREKVRPEDADKLEAVISGDKDPGRTKRGEQRHQAGQRREKKAANLKRANEIADKIAGGEGTAEDHHELADHLEGLTLDQLGILRSKIATRSGGRKKADVVGRLRDALRTGQSHAAVQRTMPKDHARLAMSGFQPNRHDVADSNGEKVKAGTGYVRYEDGRPVGYSADDAERISSSVTPEDALARIDMHDAASKDEAVDPMLRDYHAELADQLRGHHEATFGAKGKITPPSTPSPELKPSHPSPDEKSVTRQAWAANQIRKRQGKPPVDYELKLVPLDSVKPSQHGEDYINDSSKELARKVAGGKRSDRQQDNDPIALDESGNIVDGNHRHAAATMNGEKAIWAIVPKQPSITPRLGPPGGGENSNEGAAFAEKKKKEDSSANAPPPSPPQSFKVFRGTGRGYANDHGVAGKGEYWSGAKQVAESYAGKNGKVSESTIHLERPLVLSYPELNSLQEKLYGRSLTGFEPDLSEKFDKWLRDAGYDGVALFDKEISEDIPQEVIKLAQSTPVGSTTRQRDGVATPKKPDQLPGGQADNAPDAAFPTDKLAEGQKHEGEHTTDPALAKEIAKDHLAEDPAYYDKLAKVEGGSADSHRGTPSTTGDGVAKEYTREDHNKWAAGFSGDGSEYERQEMERLKQLPAHERTQLEHVFGKVGEPEPKRPDPPRKPNYGAKGPTPEQEAEEKAKMAQYRKDVKEYPQKRQEWEEKHGVQSHRLAVSAALAAGKHVPPEVLADYPDLAAKHANHQQSQQSPAVASNTGPSIADQIAAIDKRLAEVNGDDPDATADQQRQMMRLMNEKSKLADQQKRSESAKPSAAATSDPLTPHIDRLAPLIEMGQHRVITTELAQKATAELEKMPQSQVAELANRLLPDGFAGKRKSDAIYAIRKKMLTANQGYAGADDWDNWSKDQVTEMPTVSEEDKSRYREKHAAKSPAAEMSATPAPSTAPKKPKAAPKPKAAVNESVVNEHADRLAPLVERAKGERFSQEFVDETVKSVEHLPKEELRAIASKITGVGQQFIKTKQQALNDIRGKLTPLQRYDDSQLA